MISYFTDLNDNKGVFSLDRRMGFTEFFFLSLLFLYSLLSIINSSLLPITYPLLSNIKYVLILMQILFLMGIILQLISWNIQTVFLSCLSLLIFSISYMNSGLNTLLVSAVIIISMKEFDFDNILFFITLGQIIGILLVLLAVSMGIIENLVNIRFDGVRYSLGFLNANTISNYIFSVVLKIIYLTRQKKGFLIIGILNVVFFIIVLTTDSRTSLILLFLFDLFYLWYTKINNSEFIRIIHLTNRVAILIFIILSYLSAIFFSYSNPIMNELNNLFTNRISSSYKFFNLYGISMIGQRVELRSTFEAAKTNSSALILDNGYLQLAIIYGIIPSIICLVFYLKLLKKIYLNQNCVLGICVLMYIIYGFNSGLFLSWEYNFTMFYGVKIFLEKDVKI